MKSISIKNEKISSRQELFVFVLIRLGAVLSSPSVSLFRLAVELLTAALFSLFAALLVRRGLNVKAVKYLCSVGVLVLLVFDYLRLYAFLASEVHSKLSPFVIMTLLLLASVYAYFCGFEAVIRTALPLFFVGLVFVITAIICSTKAFKVTYPEYNTPSLFIPYGALDIPLLYILMSDGTEGNRESALARGVLIPYAMTAVVYIACGLSMGNAAIYSEFPVQSLFQLEGLGSAVNLDVLFSSAYIMSLFFRSSLFLRTGVSKH